MELVDLNGRPLRRETLAERVAGPTVTGIRSPQTGHPALGLTPAKLAGILRAAENGNATAYLELAEDMEERDLHYAAVLSKRKEAIAELPIEVIPADDSDEAKADAALVEEFIARDELRDELVDIQDALGKGWSVTEMEWDMSSTPWLPKRLTRVDQRFMEFDPADMETLRLRGEDGGWQPLDGFKYIIHRTPKKSGTTVRGGIARIAAWHYMFKNYSWKDWVSFLETYGMPIRLGRYDNGESEENKRILLDALAMLGSDAAAMFPKTMEVEFVNGQSGSAPSDLWAALIDKCDDYLSKLVLGQTNTTDAKAGGLGSGQANVHREVEEGIERGDARRLSVTVSRDVAVPIVMLNRGPRRRYPKIKIGRPDPVDVKALTDAAQILVPMGVKVSAKKMLEAAGLPAPEEGDDDVLLAPGAGADVPETDPETGKPIKSPTRPQQGQAAPDPNKKRSPALFEPLRGGNKGYEGDGEEAAAQQGAPGGGERDAIDRAADAWLDDWEELADDMITGIAASLNGAKTLGDVRAALIERISRADDAALIEMMAGAGVAARLQGELDVQIEQDAG